MYTHTHTHVILCYDILFISHVFCHWMLSANGSWPNRCHPHTVNISAARGKCSPPRSPAHWNEFSMCSLRFGLADTYFVFWHDALVTNKSICRGKTVVRWSCWSLKMWQLLVVLNTWKLKMGSQLVTRAIFWCRHRHPQTSLQVKHGKNKDPGGTEWQLRGTIVKGCLPQPEDVSDCILWGTKRFNKPV